MVAAPVRTHTFAFLQGLIYKGGYATRQLRGAPGRSRALGKTAGKGREEKKKARGKSINFDLIFFLLFELFWPDIWYFSVILSNFKPILFLIFFWKLSLNQSKNGQSLCYERGLCDSFFNVPSSLALREKGKQKSKNGRQEGDHCLPARAPVAFLCPFSALEAQGEDAIKRNHATYRVYEK